VDAAGVGRQELEELGEGDGRGQPQMRRDLGEVARERLLRVVRRGAARAREGRLERGRRAAQADLDPALDEVLADRRAGQGLAQVVVPEYSRGVEGRLL